MKYEEIMERMQYALSKDNMRRVYVYQRLCDGKTVIRIDTHEMKSREANKALKNIIALFRFPFVLDVVHGYNHGTAIKDMIERRLDNARIIEKLVPAYNPGETILNIA